MSDTISNPALQDKIAALRRQYVERVQEELLELENKARELGPSADNVDQESLRQVCRALHKIAGAAGTFGLTGLGEEARRLEEVTGDWLEDESVPNNQQLEELVEDIAALREEVMVPVSGSPDMGTYAAQTEPTERQGLRISILEDDYQVGQSIANALLNFGYQVEHHTSSESFQEAVTDHPPDVMVVDALIGDEQISGLETATQLKQRLDLDTPVLVVSSRTDFKTFLQAARADAIGYFVKPVDVAALEDAIESHFFASDGEPYRVLLVDDDLTLAAHYKLALEAAGMAVQVVEDPRRTLEALREFDPDVLLLDLYMPECTGPELGQIVRLHSEWLRIPIVYLSAETDSSRQAQALTRAGEDFLTKPIADESLVAAMQARAKRSRDLREALHKDSLTGLLKHASIKEQLHLELERSQRSHRPASVVLLDLDHFKTVNDSYGHAAGDNVLRTLANLLRQRLRRSDSAGRYGGEEFVLILPDCEEDHARRLMDDIRQRMGGIQFIHEGQEYRVTLSAGVASTNMFSSVESLLEGADKAMYAAKKAGRNRIHIAEKDD